MTRLLAILAFVPCLALANPFKDSIDDATDALEDAVKAANRGGSPNCKTLVNGIGRSIDDLESIRRGTTERRLNELLVNVTQLQVQSIQLGCPQKVADRVNLAVSTLNGARSQLDRDDDRKEHRHRHKDDDDDDRMPPNNNPPPPPPPGRALEATLGELRVIYGERVNGEAGVRVDLPSASVRGIGRTPFYFAGHIRSQAGEWTDWVAGPQYTAPSDPYVWNNVYTQFFPARLLRSTSGSQFLVRISMFDGNRNELAFKEARIDLVAAGGPQGAPGPAGPPPPAAARDCGTGDDPGCTMSRGRGGWAMDRDSFNGFYNSLRATPSDLTKADMCRSVLAANYVTAKQLGMVLELFNSDLTRLDVAKLAAPHTVNPMHALGLSTKFRSSLIAADFTKLMSEQR